MPRFTADRALPAAFDHTQQTPRYERCLIKTPSPSLVVSCIALAVALGGTAYAVTALPKNSVGTAQIKKDAVTGAKIKAGSIDATDLRPGVLLSGASAAKGDTGAAGATGAPGATGAAGDTGAIGPSGITATGSVADANLTTLSTTGTTAVVSLGAAGSTPDRQSTGPITVSVPSTLIINASASFTHRTGQEQQVDCWLTVDGVDLYGQAGTYGTWATWNPVGSGSTTIPVTGSRAVSAGAHDVAVTCLHSSGSGTLQFTRGALTVVAATAPPA